MKIYVKGTIHIATAGKEYVLAQLAKVFAWTTLEVSDDMSEFVDGTPVEIYEEIVYESREKQ